MLQRPLVSAVVVALGVAAAGFFVGVGPIVARATDRFVEVQGRATREVTATRAVWPLRVRATAETLGTAQAQLARSTQLVLDFLARHSIQAGATSLHDLAIPDARAGGRYVVEQTVLVRSDKPDLVQAASQDLADLLASGVVLASDGGAGAGGPRFLYPGVDGVRAALVTEAVANATALAGQIAQKAGARLDGLRQATPGDLRILPREPAPGVDETTQIKKIIVVDATVRYGLR